VAAVVPVVADGAGAAGELLLAVGLLAVELGAVLVLPGAVALAGVAAEDALGVDVEDLESDVSLDETPLPAAFSNSARWVRNSTSFARIAGSSVTVPDVPTAPGVPAVGVGDSSVF
jgi:hypothetical protein